MRTSLLLCFLLLMACSGGRELTEVEQAKLHPLLQRLITDPEAGDTGVEVGLRPDGQKVYGVIIRTAQPDDLRKAGIPVESVTGDVVTARLTLQELRSVAAIPSVRWIETGSQNFPQQ